MNLAVASAKKTRRDRGAPEDARAQLHAEVRAGRLDGDAVHSVLHAAGHQTTRRRTLPAGLTPREVEVLRLLARGLSNKQIAALTVDLRPQL